VVVDDTGYPEIISMDMVEYNFQGPGIMKPVGQYDFRIIVLQGNNEFLFRFKIIDLIAIDNNPDL
jgi:hypothetical protein